MLEMLNYVTRLPGMNLHVDMSMLNVIEVIWIRVNAATVRAYRPVRGTKHAATVRA